VNQTPVVSVIVPCFNYGHLLSECLESVRHQSLVEWECIVVDDGSGDETQAIARGYCLKDARFAYVHQENRGPSAARNSGLRRAAGEFIQLLDADDLLELEKLKKHTRFLAQQKEYSLVYGPMRYFTTGESGRIFSRGRNRGDRDWMIMWPDTTDEMLAALVQENLFQYLQRCSGNRYCVKSDILTNRFRRTKTGSSGFAWRSPAALLRRGRAADHDADPRTPRESVETLHHDDGVPRHGAKANREACTDRTYSGRRIASA
jgi:glycosyltransferase involved in cell wall biosynthesis